MADLTSLVLPNPLKTLVIENNENCRLFLENMLKNYPAVSLAGCATTVEGGAALFNEIKPDLLFLDVELDDGLGFDLLKKLTPDDFEVIFTTAHQNYALQAIKMSALDYLLKPVDREELENAILKAVSKPHTRQNLSKLLQNISAENNQDRFIGLPEAEGTRFVKLGNVIYCKSEGSYTYFQLGFDNKITVSSNLKKFEGLLSNSDFFRIHNSYLINLNQISQVTRKDGGFVIMSNGSEIPISRRRKELFMQTLKEKSIL